MAIFIPVREHKPAVPLKEGGGRTQNGRVAEPGQVLENPRTDERLVFLETSESTGGELVSFELVFRPRGYTAIKHVQPNQEERHEVLEGRLGVEVDGRRQTLGP